MFYWHINKRISSAIKTASNFSQNDVCINIISMRYNVAYRLYKVSIYNCELTSWKSSLSLLLVANTKQMEPVLLKWLKLMSESQFHK